MRWFKHDTDAFTSEGVDYLIQKLGMAGYGRWNRLLEIVAFKMDETDRCHVEYSWHKWCQLLGASNRKQLKTFFVAVEEHLKTIIIANEKRVRIEIPNLLKKQDNYTQQLRRNLQATSHQEVEVEVEVEEEEKKGARSSSRFKPPTPEEVSEYALTLEPSYTIDGEAFCAFYASKGWKVGNSPMKSWEHAVVTWKKRDEAKAQEGHQPKTLTLSDAKAELRHDSFYYESEVESRCLKLSVEDAEMLRQWARERWPEEKREEPTDEDRETTKAKISKMLDEIGGKA